MKKWKLIRISSFKKFQKVPIWILEDFTKMYNYRFDPTNFFHYFLATF